MLVRTVSGTLLLAVLSHAALLRIEVKERSDVPNSSYERIVGRAYFAVDPALPVNRSIVDLDKAPQNSEGLVEFSADFYILKPVDMTKGNGALLEEVPNRGSKNALAFFDDAPGSANANNPSVEVDGGRGGLRCPRWRFGLV